MKPSDNKQAFNDHLKSVHAEGQGVWQLTFVSRTNILYLLAQSYQGVTHATSVLKSISQTLDRFAKTKNRRSATLCLLCDTPFWHHENPAAFCFLSAAVDGPARAIMSGICSACLVKHQTDIKPVILAKYRETIPDLREITPTTPGHA